MRQIKVNRSNLKKIYRSNENSVHKQLAEYLKWQYPKVNFRTDFAAGIKLTIGQAVKHKSLQKGRAWPDVFIAKPKNGYSGLFIELKRDGERIYKKDGSFASDHLKEQYECLVDLQNDGYCAVFAVGFAEAKSIIDAYLSENRLKAGPWM